MNQRLLGQTGIRVSEIAFGGVEIGLPYGIGVHSTTDMPSRSEAIRLLHSAVDNGINFFDTARMYGVSESIMGQAFHDRRDHVVVSTKCLHLRDESGELPSLDKIREIIAVAASTHITKVLNWRKKILNTESLFSDLISL